MDVRLSACICHPDRERRGTCRRGRSRNGAGHRIQIKSCWQCPCPSDDVPGQRWGSTGGLQGAVVGLIERPARKRSGGNRQHSRGRNDSQADRLLHSLRGRRIIAQRHHVGSGPLASGEARDHAGCRIEGKIGRKRRRDGPCVRERASRTADRGRIGLVERPRWKRGGGNGQTSPCRAAVPAASKPEKGNTRKDGCTNKRTNYAPALHEVFSCAHRMSRTCSVPNHGA